VMADRQVLQRLLRKAASGVPMRLGVGVESIAAFDADAGVDVVFTDGTRGRYAVVVGADGIRSRVRALCFGAIRPDYVGQTYWRTSAGVDLVEHATIMFDADRYVAVMPLGGGRSYLAWQLRAPEPFDDPVDGRIARLRERFGDFAEPGASALAALADDAALHFGPSEELAIDAWQRGPILLVGDAAHALSPSMAQGGSLAIEDAVVLAEELARAARGGAGTAGLDPIATRAALAACVARRRPRIEWVRQRTRVEIAQLNRGAGHLDERTASVQAVLGASI